MQNITFDLNQVFRDVIDRMEDDGEFSREVYDDLIVEVLEEKRELGELSDDNDIQEYVEKLKARWPEAEASFETGHDDAVLNQD
ncbi:MAG: hypothetical protein HY975_01725 [Candidatus Kerfeldbacteria bacterium]|nr:hypothetical protein [Candidatus Kerfeldbacteria bacterium]